MKKKLLIKKYFAQGGRLTLANGQYRAVVKKWLWSFLAEDLGARGDVTSDALIANNKLTGAIIIAKANGVVAGVEEVKWFLSQQGLRVRVYKKDGARVRAGERVLMINGKIKDILKTERTALNVLQRMSGIATAGANLAARCGALTLICPTRKTHWGLMDKKAVAAGGGGTHRLGLDDFILIKDNHLKFLNGKIADKALVWKKKNIFWEIEVDNWAQMVNYAKLNPGALMLDNFTPARAAQAVKFLRAHHPDIIVEISGGVNAANISRYARAGADVISMGSLTHSVHALDLSLEIL